MLALDPRAVRMDRLQPGGDRPRDYGSAGAALTRPFRLRSETDAGEEYTATGALGDPRAASAFKGERILAEIVGELEAALRVIFPDAFSEAQQNS